MKVKINENTLRKIVAESVKKVINEIGDTKKGQYLLGKIADRAYHRDLDTGKLSGGNPNPTWRDWEEKAYDERKGNKKQKSMAKAYTKGIRNAVKDGSCWGGKITQNAMKKYNLERMSKIMSYCPYQGCPYFVDLNYKGEWRTTTLGLNHSYGDINDIEPIKTKSENGAKRLADWWGKYGKATPNDESVNLCDWHSWYKNEGE